MISQQIDDLCGSVCGPLPCQASYTYFFTEPHVSCISSYGPVLFLMNNEASRCYGMHTIYQSTVKPGAPNTVNRKTVRVTSGSHEN